MASAGRAEKKQNAAAVPNIRDSGESLYQGLVRIYRTSQGGKNVNGDFVLRPKLMNNPVSIGINTTGFKSVKI